MIWFIFVPVIAALISSLEYMATHRQGRKGSPGVAFFITFFLGAIVAIVLNLALGAVLPNNVVTHDAKAIDGPVRVVSDDGSLALSVTAADRNTYTTDTRAMLTPVFNDSPDRTVQMRDYTVHNAWLSVFNYKNNDLVINIPKSEHVELGH